VERALVIRSELQLPDTLSREYLENYRILPLAVRDGRLLVAAVGDLDDLALIFSAETQLVPTDDESLLEGIQVAMDATHSLGTIEATDIERVREHGHLADARDLDQQPPVVRYVSLLIREAHDSGASDVHLESGREGLGVRLRLDGVLIAGTPPPRGLEAAVVSRIKLLADLDIAERRVPQDGRIRIRLAERELDVRVSTVPSLHGEGVVMRLLDRGGRPTELAELGMDPRTLESFTTMIRRPHGIVLVTGPTGSGKTTTLHAAMLMRDLRSEKLVAIEDPVEYQLSGITQIPVNVRAGLGFATVLRSVVRHDPDVIMVGEMRDEETASIATRAAMTGHLVLSTLHTNDAISAIARLADLGVPPYLVGSTLEGVLAQRLVRRLCRTCQVSYEPDPQLVALIAGRPVGRMSLRRGAGCDGCRGTGFRGRVGLFELLIVTDHGRDAIARNAVRDDLRVALRDARVQTLREDGWVKIQAGLTTIDEVLRVADA
jgi:type II secretory ATPase GspE/PulE/Tfp pilus assembly ATPase PilB-like protein